MKESKNLLLSIIVPVYNVEKYIHPCLDSIFRQGLDEDIFEVIIVNDGTEDRSMEVIQDIIEQHKNITVLNQKNLSLSVARNNGIALAKGQYILMPDSDDLLIKNSLKPLLKKALESQADLVVADFYRITSEEIESFDEITQCYPESKEKNGEQLYLEDLNTYQCYVWRTLYRRAFIIENQITFIPGIRYQDVPFTHECYLKAGKCLRVAWHLNIYRIRRPGSNTFSFSIENVRSFSIAIGATWNLRDIEGLSPQKLYRLEENVYKLFSLFIYHTLHSIRSYSSRNKVIDFFNAQTPSLNFTHGIRQRCTTFMIKKLPHFYINLYYIYARTLYKHIKKH